MEYNTEMARLEQFIDTLLEKYTQLKTEHHALQDLVQQRENECAQLKDQVLELSAERQEVGHKVTGLLDRIEQWEQEQQQAGNSQQDTQLSAEELSILNAD